MSLKRKVVLQLDYYMSSQFAGVAVGIRKGLYKNAGINLEWLHPCKPGDEAKVVVDNFQRDGGKNLWVGTMEQNTLLPAVAQGCQVKAVSAMFGKSPLCLAGLPGANLATRLRNGEPLRVGAHVDTVELLQRIMPKAHVEAFPRGSKMELLHGGSIDAVQAYDVMETLRLQHDLSATPEVVPLEGRAFPGVSLGYAQVLFTPEQALDDAAHRQLLHDFIKTTFEGWSQAIRDPSAAAEAVMELQDENIDHWVHTRDFTERSIRTCSDYVKRTMRCGQLGIIDVARWNKAEEWLTQSAPVPVRGTLDPSIWQMDEHHVDGQPVAQSLRDETQDLAEQAQAQRGRAPKLAVMSVGGPWMWTGKHSNGEKRLQYFARTHASWFSKTESGAAHGIEVEEVDLPMDITTEALAEEIRSRGDADGIQLVMPLPPQIDLELIREALPARQDVDGIHFFNRAELQGSHAPVTCGGFLRIVDDYGVSVEGKHIVVIGRSRLLGQPLAQLLLERGATVTLAHKRTEDLKALCKQADIVVSAAGVPRMIRGDWIKTGATVINLGTTFEPENETIVPDIAEFKELNHAKLVVRTVGPIAAAKLFHNVAQNAALRA